MMADPYFEIYFDLTADIIPLPETNEMEVCVHSMANPRTNRAIEHLLQELNTPPVTYPGTKLRLVYLLVGASSGWEN